MTEPTGDLFARATQKREALTTKSEMNAEAVRLLKSSQRNEARAASERLKEAERLSTERVNEFLKIVKPHQDLAPQTKFHAASTKDLMPGHRDPWTEVIEDHNHMEGTGWVLLSYAKNFYPGYGSYDRPKDRYGIALSADGVIYSVLSEENNSGSVGVQLRSDAHFATDDGYALLVDYVAKSNIPIPLAVSGPEE